LENRRILQTGLITIGGRVNSPVNKIDFFSGSSAPLSALRSMGCGPTEEHNMTMTDAEIAELASAFHELIEITKGLPQDSIDARENWEVIWRLSELLEKPGRLND